MFVGHSVTSDGIAPDPNKVSAIMESEKGIVV